MLFDSFREGRGAQTSSRQRFGYQASNKEYRNHIQLVSFSHTSKIILRKRGSNEVRSVTVTLLTQVMQ